MATYVVERDDYAGWTGAGRNFAMFGLAAGAIAWMGWAATHGHLRWLQPADASDQLFLSAMVWIGGGVFAIMAICVLGSLMLSDRSRGRVIVNDVGVERQIGERSRTLAWHEIEGFAARPYGGATLISREGTCRIEIPRFLDDYRGCIAELKAKGLGSLPSSRLRKKMTWLQRIRAFVLAMAWFFAYDAKRPHAVRIEGGCILIALLFWMMAEDEQSEDSEWLRWVGRVAIIVLMAWLL